MIPLPSTALPPPIQTQLSEYQQEVDGLTDYEERVKQARSRFGAYNIKGNPTFEGVKTVLTRMCSGARRCGYCEDSAADEVEHIRPKTLYPELVFAWENYLYVCGPCNGPKNNQFAVFAEGAEEPVPISRRRKDPVVPPPTGSPVLIDPRVEDPTDFMTLDLRDTFWFVPRAKKGTRDHARAQYTIGVLRLNTRDLLPQARRSAYLDYCGHLAHYLRLRDQGGSPEARLELIREVRTRQHPTVWWEMKRQHESLPRLKSLFEAAPEALTW